LSDYLLNFNYIQMPNEDPVPTPDLATLQAQVAQLLAENKQFKAAQLEAQKASCKQFTDLILPVVISGKTMELDFENLKDNMEKDALFVDIGKANNPNSDILGFQFLEIIKLLAEEHLLKGLPEEDYARFQHNIADVVNIPFLKIVLRSNPVGLLVSRVVDTVTNFVKSVRVRGKNVTSVERAFDEKKLANFFTALEKYVHFYDALLLSAREYQDSVRQLTSKKNELEVTIEDYHSNFLKALQITSTNGAEIMRQVGERFLPKSDEDYVKIVQDEDNIKAHAIAARFPVLMQDINQLKVNYYKVYSKYLANFIKDLSIASEFTQDQKKVTDLKDRVQNKLKEIEAEVQELQIEMKN